jgi:hypothetical protein
MAHGGHRIELAKNMRVSAELWRTGCLTERFSPKRMATTIEPGVEGWRQRQSVFPHVGDARAEMIETAAPKPGRFGDL